MQEYAIVLKWTDLKESHRLAVEKKLSDQVKVATASIRAADEAQLARTPSRSTRMPSSMVPVGKENSPTPDRINLERQPDLRVADTPPATTQMRWLQQFEAKAGSHVFSPGWSPALPPGKATKSQHEGPEALLCSMVQGLQLPARERYRRMGLDNGADN